MNHNTSLQRFLQLLGLAMRARAVITGDGTCISAVRSRQAKLVILANDAGPNTSKKYQDKCMTYGVPLLILGDKCLLGNALGKDQRAVVVVTQEGFANRLLQVMQENNGGDAIDENASV